MILGAKLLSAYTAQLRLTPLRIVIDANVLFSACISSQGASRELYRLAAEEHIILILCDYTIEEVYKHFHNDKRWIPLKWLEKSLASLTYQYESTPSMFDVMNNLHLIPEDHKDVPYLILARNSNATHIVSFDKHLLDLNQYTYNNHSIPILKAGECLDIVRATL